MKNLILRFTFSVCIRNFLKLIVGVKFDKSGFLRKEKQFIIVANHNSHLDAMAIMSSLPASIIPKVKAVAAKDYFGKTKFQERISNYFINTLLIDRQRNLKNPTADPVAKMNQAIKEGYSLIIFPEGSRGKPDEVQPLKKGIALVLLSNKGLKYVPIYLNGLGKAMPKGDSLIVPHTASLTYGTPKLIESDNTQDVLEQIQKDIFELKDKEI